jgi:deoxyribodipyrimidine photo-lyase
MTKSRTPARVFTPFRRAWDQRPRPDPLPVPDGVEWRSASGVPPSALRELSRITRPAYFGDIPDEAPRFDPRVGERGAWATLRAFTSEIDRYSEHRNLPGEAGTSRLSAHLHFGTIHPRQVLAAVAGVTQGAEVFRSELAWREFYADVLWHRPESAWQNLQPAFARLRVDTDERAIARFQTWARGETGYPFVDAGMRQLLSEGWMHNRARMVTASFLVKHLHLDWRWGAKWFLWRLIDGDVASNQHGWQWTAGTGTDPSPFQRIFNPTLQGERFDPEGRYVRRYVEELRDVAAPACLEPGGGEGLLAPTNYPRPMVDLGRERLEALVRYGEVRGR